MKPFDKIAFAKRVLRMATRKTPGYHKALARTKYVIYPLKKDGTPADKYENRWTCEQCSVSDLKKADIELDHTVPIALAESLEDWVDRLFCDESSYQILCKPCHKVKSSKDKSEIAARKRERKEKASGKDL